MTVQYVDIQNKYKSPRKKRDLKFEKSGHRHKLREFAYKSVSNMNPSLLRAYKST